MIRGLSHLTLAVRDLKESFAFYRDVLGFKPLMLKPRHAYFLAGDLWVCLEEDPSARAREDYTHFAFSVDADDFAAFAARIRAGARTFKENRSEGDSLYFLDPTGHKLEIHVGDVRSRLAVYRGQPDTQIFD